MQHTQNMKINTKQPKNREGPENSRMKRLQLTAGQTLESPQWSRQAVRTGPRSPGAGHGSVPERLGVATDLFFLGCDRVTREFILVCEDRDEGPGVGYARGRVSTPATPIIGT